MTMSSENLAEILQPENFETLTPRTSGSKRPRQRVREPLNQQNLDQNEPIVELESDTDINDQQKTGRNNVKRKKTSIKIDLNKIADQLVLIPNAKPLGQSWIWGYFDQYEPIEQYKRIVKCLVQVQRKNGVESCGHFMGSDNSTGNFIVHLASHRITEESHKRRMGEIRKNNQLSQTRIDEIIRNNPDVKNCRDRKFVGILIKDNRPISICNDEGLIEFIREFDSNYQIPSDKIIHQLLAEAYNQIKVVLVKKFNEEIISCSITTDLWTARSRSGYIGVTCSFVNNNFDICEAILAVQYVPYPHTGDNICENLEKNDEYLRMIADVDTRWNSSYLAWKRLIKIKDLIDILASTMLIDPDLSTRRDGKRLKNINLTENEWQEISKLIIILEDFAGATEYLGGSKYATISLMYSVLAMIKQKILPDNDSNVEDIDLTNSDTAFDDDVGYEDAPEDESISEQPKRRKININTPQNCTDLEKRVKAALYRSMNHYWEVPQEQGMLAALLDPRFIELRFASNSLRIRTQEQLKSAYQEMKNLTSNEDQESELQPVSSNSLLVRMFQNDAISIDEVANYLALPKIHHDDCPLTWWRINKTRFPVLSKLARKYLAIPATSTLSERLFSEAGNVMTIKRTQLAPNMLENLVFCKKNWHLAGGVFPLKY
ncbi:unnamed protein product [Rhizophagus irregularis]|uniref:HAT C-terminal dimerisation domain-containing protein n=1 Tax=Rhizophagus irregularis TaxID=588596 RepID=A0A915ZMT1_9GLOM|nr:unnamed protein product [Rhizophagus irregularis]